MTLEIRLYLGLILRNKLMLNIEIMRCEIELEDFQLEVLFDGFKV